MAGRDQERRDAYAQEHGYDTYNEFRQARDSFRERQEERGIEVDAYQARDVLDFERDLDVEGSTRQEIIDAWHEAFGYDDDDALWAWLHDYYERN